MSVLLAKTWTGSDPAGWWMSEKLDGVRAVWDGLDLRSRTGNVLDAPQWWRDLLPPISLDGELWIGRGKFQQVVGQVCSAAGDWRDVRYMVFDAPATAGAFEERMAIAADSVVGSRVAAVVEHARCQGDWHLRQELGRVENVGGEGLMLRQPFSHYEAVRSSTLLKVKSSADAEAVVVGHEQGSGRHAGCLGALVVQMNDGTTFRLGTGLTDRLRRRPPRIGTTVTFKFQGMTDAGIPRFASFLRVTPAA